MTETDRSSGDARPARPSGSPNEHPREEILRIQRARIVEALVETVQDTGYATLTVSRIVSRAQVPRGTFYEAFEDRDDCFRVALTQAIDEGRTLMKGPSPAEGSWTERTRTRLARLLAAMESSHGRARLVLVDALVGGRDAHLLRAEALDELADLLDHARHEPGTLQPPRFTGEALVGAIVAILTRRLLQSQTPQLTSLLNQLMSIVVLPYFGPVAAQNELGRPVPKLAQPPSRRHERATVQVPKLRLTYRTSLVLQAVAATPGASNRRIAQEAGIADQGQISKLLRRLARLDILVNLGDGQPMGAANAWYLTSRGEALTHRRNAGASIALTSIGS